MAGTRKTRVPMAQQIRLINECRQSRPKQDMVPIDIVPDHMPKQHTASQMQNSYLDNSHTIEVAIKDIIIRISNAAAPVLLTRTFRLLQELSC